MSKLSKKQVEHIAKLARLHLKEKDLEKFSSQLSSVLGYISELSKVDTKKNEPIGNITGLSTIMREDEIEPSFLREEILKNAPQKESGFLKVKAIFDKA